jgi:ribosomal protein L29
MKAFEFDLNELRKMDAQKLKEEALKAKKEAFKIHFEVKNGQSKNHHPISSFRKYIAQIHTILREKELNAKS